MAAAHMELGDLYYSRQLGKAQALQEYLKALDLGGDQLQEKEKNRIRWNIARISQEMENWEEALKYYRMVYESNPRYDPKLMGWFIEVYMHLADKVAPTDPEKAISTLREALGYQPGETSVRFRLAELLAGRKRYEEALKELDTLFTFDQRYGNAHYLAAQCLTKQGKVIEARNELLEELRTNPKHLDSLVELGEISSGTRSATRMPSLSRPTTFSGLLERRRMWRASRYLRISAGSR